MKILSILFFVSLIGGQLTGLMVAPGVTVYAHDFFAILIVTFFLAQRLQKKKRLVWGPLGPAIAAFIIVDILSLLVNINAFAPDALAQGSLYLVRWTIYALLSVVVLGSPLSGSLWLWGLYLAGVGVAAAGLVQYVWYPYLRNLYYLGWDPHLGRVFSTFLDPNFVGLFFILTLFLGVWLWKKFPRFHPLLVVGEGISALALLLTFSRSSYLTLIAGVLVFVGMTRQWKYALLFLGLFFAIVFLFPKEGEGQRLDRIVSSVARVGNWQRSVALFSEAPVLGHGFNTLRALQTARGPVQEEDIISRAAGGVDNSILFIGITAGIIGILIYGWLLLRMLQLGLSVGKKDSTLRTVFVATLAAVVVHSQLNNSLFYPWIMLWIWILVGVVCRTLTSGTSRGAGR